MTTKERMNLSPGDSTHIYVRNLNKTIDDAALLEECLRYGTVVSAKVMIDVDTGRSKGFGLVKFSSSEEASKALADMNGRSIRSKPIAVALARGARIAAKDSANSTSSTKQGKLDVGRWTYFNDSNDPVCYPSSRMHPPANNLIYNGQNITPAASCPPAPCSSYQGFQRHWNGRAM